MTTHLFKMISVGAVVTLAGFSSGAALAESEADRQANYQAAETSRMELEYVVRNTSSFIAGLVSKWQIAAGNRSGWSAEFTEALKATTAERLLAVNKAGSYNEVRAILQGRANAINGVGGGSIKDLGDTTQDLTFTPLNPPCRIFDTRFYGGGVAPGAGTTRHYVVHGSGAQMTAQGGNGAGCPAPKGEPVGIAGNFTAVPIVTGHLRVFPFGGVLPTVSFLNFTAGINIANAGIVSTCFLCGDDLSVYNAAQTHHIADVSGYFYPADIGLGIETRQGGYDIGVNSVAATDTVYTDNFIGSTNGSSIITVTAGSEVHWWASAMVHRTAGANNRISGSFKGCFRNTGTLAITEMPGFNSETDFTVASTGSNDQSSIQVSARQASMPAGTFEFGFCAKAGNSIFGALDSYSVFGVKINVTKIRR